MNNTIEDVWIEAHNWENQILTINHDDYCADIFLKDDKYSVKIYLEDLCGISDIVAYKEFTSLDESKNFAIKRMSRKI